MTKNELKELEIFLNFLQDKVDEVYSKETQRAIERFLDRAKNGTLGIDLD